MPKKAEVKIQVTIIESDAMVSSLLKTALHNRNFCVTMCSEKSLKEVCASRPDILIVDMGFPYELGVQFCQNVLLKFPECRLLPMTGRLEHPDGVALSDGSSVHVLQKPFSLHVMLDQIESLAVQCRQHDLVSGLNEDVSTRQIRHEMRNVAMVVCGSATLLRAAAEGDPALKGIADKVDSACHRGFDEITLALLQQHCQNCHRQLWRKYTLQG